MTWFLAAALLMQAQDEVRVTSHAYLPPSPYTLRTDTDLVEIAAAVRDAHGKPVSGLTKADFHILDDKKEREIAAFEVETVPRVAPIPNAAITEKTGPNSAAATSSVRPPRFLALFIDDVNAKDRAHAGELKQTQMAAEKFVKEALGTGVRIGVFTVSGTPSLDFTTDETKVLDAIAAIKPHVRMPENGLTDPCPWIPPYLAMKIVVEQDRSALSVVLADSAHKHRSQLCPTATRDQVRNQAEETWRRVKEISTDTLNAIGSVVVHLGTMPGRRELLIASSGFLLDVSNQELKDKIIDRALHAGVTISALDSKGLFVDNPTDPTRLIEAQYKATETKAWVMTLNLPMANLAEATGGVFYHNSNDLTAGFHELGTAPDVIYHLSFRPDGIAPDGSYHRLKVNLTDNKGNGTLQYRPGYFASAEAPKAETLQSKIDSEILAENTVADLPVGIAVKQVKATLSVTVTVDISKLRFTNQGDRQIQRIAFTTALIDARGNIAAAKEGVMDLALTEATYKRLASTGLNAVMTLPVSPGTYKLRQVVEEGVDGKMACSTHSIAIQ
jgi:VWFA-related protein